MPSESTTFAETGSNLVNIRELSKLRWRCRRGLLENDLFLQRFFNRHAEHLTQAQANALHALMDLSDNDLLDIHLQRKRLDALFVEHPMLDHPDVKTVVAMLQLPL